MTPLGRHSPREDFRNRVANLRIEAALTISVSRDPEAHGPQDGIEPSQAEVFNRPQPAPGETFSPLFTMLLQLLLYYGVLQPIRNLLRFLKIDSEVFRSRTPGEPFDGAQRNRGSKRFGRSRQRAGFLEPMKAKLVNSIPPGDWIDEVNFDGYRALALRGGPRLACRTLRTGRSRLIRKQLESGRFAKDART
jgi:hypothetical protein